MRRRGPVPAEKEDREGDNPALSDVIERNIRTIIRLRLKAARERGAQDRITDTITSFLGSMVFNGLRLCTFRVVWPLGSSQERTFWRASIRRIPARTLDNDRCAAIFGAMEKVGFARTVRMRAHGLGVNDFGVHGSRTDRSPVSPCEKRSVIAPNNCWS